MQIFITFVPKVCTFVKKTQRRSRKLPTRVLVNFYLVRKSFSSVASKGFKPLNKVFRTESVHTPINIRSNHTLERGSLEVGVFVADADAVAVNFEKSLTATTTAKPTMGFRLRGFAVAVGFSRIFRGRGRGWFFNNLSRSGFKNLLIFVAVTWPHFDLQQHDFEKTFKSFNFKNMSILFYFEIQGKNII